MATLPFFENERDEESDIMFGYVHKKTLKLSYIQHGDHLYLCLLVLVLAQLLPGQHHSADNPDQHHHQGNSCNNTVLELE